MKKLILSILSLLILLISNPVFAQEKTEMAIVLLSNQALANVNMNEERFLNYAKKLTDELNEIFENNLAARDIVVLFNIKKDTIPEIEISARPGFSSDSINLILSKLRKIRPLNTKFIDFSFLYQIYTNGGCPIVSLEFTPEVINPFVIAEKRYKAAAVEKKVELLKEWAIIDVLPILSAFEKKTDNQFKGVRITGDQIAAIDFDTILNVKELTDYNAYYWRGVMEMNINNFLLTASKVFLHVAAGEFDIAQRYIDIFSMFKQDNTVADYYLDELSLKLNAFYKDLNVEINKGIKHHDEGNYNKALVVYDKVLSYYPHSAWTNYEVFYSTHAIEMQNNGDSSAYGENWIAFKPKVYTCDPLYPMDVNAQSRKEAWLLFRRMEINQLFSSGNDAKQEFVKYADIAFDLEAWSFAAHMYWMVFTHFSAADYGKKRNIMAYYLYCLDKLGQNDILLLIDLNYSREFKKIEKERKKVMEESDVYKAFK